MTENPSEMYWLQEAPKDFFSLCRAVSAAGRDARAENIQALANFRLDALQSAALSRAVGKARKAGARLTPLSGFRLGLLSGATIDTLVDCLPAAAARYGVALEVVTTAYDQVMQEALDPRSGINTGELDAVVVDVDYRWLQLQRNVLTGDAEAQVSAAVGRLRSVVEALRLNGRAIPIIQTLAIPPLPLFGSYDRRVKGSIRSLIIEANRRIVSLADETGAYLLDTAALAERIGTERWFDPVQWGAYKFAFSAECYPAYADQLARILGAIRGKSRKCLVLDLDNTVWGGVIGDDGIEGIKIGQGSAVGEAFLGLQQYALELRERGVILAVSSKNDDAVARRVFKEHPEMLLRESHISVFQANWSEKFRNLEAIAQKLNIGLDALVLVDDNPAERAQVRAALPMVAVPELPKDPSWYARAVAAAGYFEAVGFSAEDRLRAESYASDAQRAEVRAQARDLGDYLLSLEMVLTVKPFDQQGRQRIVQLINKTNQFNLTTRRYTEAEVVAMEADPSISTFQVRLEDKFGDLGMIAVVIARTSVEAQETVWDLDTWLMSCRVLGRKVEEVMLNRVVEAARNQRVARLRGRYVPTAKNGMVADFYTRLGFRTVEPSADGGAIFEQKIADHAPVEPPMKVVDHGQAFSAAEQEGREAAA